MCLIVGLQMLCPRAQGGDAFPDRRLAGLRDLGGVHHYGGLDLVDIISYLGIQCRACNWSR